MKSDEIEDYARQVSTEETDVLKKINRETHLKVLRPRMLAGHLQGTLLQMISGMIKPKQILEIGTFTGYSAICLAQGLQKDGHVHTIEINGELEERIQKNIKDAGLEKEIKLYMGDALSVIPTLNYKFDLVFIDADKEHNLEYYTLIFDKINSGGFILVDNALWGGKIFDEVKPADKETKGVIEFNEYIKKDSRVKKLLLPFRDGLMIIQKS